MVWSCIRTFTCKPESHELGTFGTTELPLMSKPGDTMHMGRKQKPGRNLQKPGRNPTFAREIVAVCLANELIRPVK